MRTKGFVMTAVILFLAIVFTGMAAMAKDEGPKELKFKEIYLGMPIEEAREICRKHMDQYMTMEKISPDKDFIFQTGATIGIIVADTHQRLEAIVLGRPMVDRMFNAEGMPVKQFGHQFIEAYGIPSMESFREQGDRGWQFVSPHGYQVKLFLNGQLSLEKIAKRDSLKFD